MIEQETLRGVFERHAILGRAAREAVKAMGLELFGPEDEHANVVTVARTPEGIDGAAIPKTMRDKFGITIAGGQGHLKGKIVRIAHCGYYGAFDVLTSIAALEMALDELGPRRDLRRGHRRGAGGLRARRRAGRAAGRLGRLMADENGYRVLVKEKIADAGVDLLREHFDVDVRTDMSEEELPGAIADYDAIVIRSATKLTADVIERADRLKVIGRAGIGVDNVDVPAATKHGIIVANAPESNIIAAAEHTIAMMLAQARNIPQAHASLKSGKWERSQLRRGGGVREDARHPRLRPHRPAGRRARQAPSACTCVAFDPFVGGRALPRAGRRARREPRGPLRARRHHHDPPAEDAGDDRLRERRGLRADEGRRADRELRARRADRPRRARARRSTSGKVGGASLDVFPEEPMTEHPIFAYENVVVTPHLGASTAEAQDRAGVITAEQVVAALQRRPRLERGQHPEGPQRGPRRARALPAARRAARAARDVARRRPRRSTGSRSATTATWPSSTPAC